MSSKLKVLKVLDHNSDMNMTREVFSGDYIKSSSEESESYKDFRQLE